MSDLYNRILEAYTGYLRYLADGGERVQLPPALPKPEEFVGETYVYASSLGKCPLLEAKRRMKVLETNPLPEIMKTGQLAMMQFGVLC